MCVYIYIYIYMHIFFSIWRCWLRKRNTHIGTAVNAASQGSLSAYHFGHVLHKFVNLSLYVFYTHHIVF